LKSSHLQRLLLPIILLAVSTIGAWLVRDILTLPNFTMIYLLIVLIIAIRRGIGMAFVAAFVSFLCLNYFLVRPYYTFIVADPRELLDLLVFLIVATLAGQLGARVRQQADEARQQAYEQEILYRLTQSFNQLTTREGVFESLTHMMQHDLAARSVYILPYANPAEVKDQTIHYILLQANNQIYATLCVAFDTPQMAHQLRLLNTCALQAAMALYRIELTERARKSQQFEESDRLKTAILHAVSHDLRTPITIIKTSASNLRQLGDRLPPEERLETAETIEHEADQLNKLVGNLLDMSRLNAGALTLNSRPNSLEEVAGDVAARAWQLSGQERIKISFPDDIPLVNLDYGLLLQALTNLVDNSLRYEPSGSQIEIRGTLQENEARLMVINHGETIPAEERSHIMEPFYRGKDGHVGLGLPIAKGIVEAHHGRLWVEETPGGGETFIIALPLKAKEHDA